MFTSSSSERRLAKPGSPVYFMQDISQPNFKPSLSDISTEYVLPQQISQQNFEPMFTFENQSRGVLDIYYNQKQFEEAKQFFEEDKDQQEMSQIAKAFIGDNWEEVIPQEFRELVSKRDEKQEKNFRDDEERYQTKLQKKKALETNIAKMIVTGEKGKDYKVAKSNGVSTYTVSKVRQSLLRTGQIPSLNAPMKRRLLLLPPSRTIVKFLYQLYLESSQLGFDWSTLVQRVKTEFPELQRFKDKTIQNHLHRQMRIRSMMHKRLPYKQDSLSLIHKQLVLANLMLRLIKKGSKILYFDQTTFNVAGFKHKSLGTTEMPPLHRFEQKPLALHMLTVFSLDGWMAFRVSRESATSECVKDFLTHVITRLCLQTSEQNYGWNIVLDNAKYQRTKDILSLPEWLPVNLIYNIPTSPFLNLIEDVFLKLKESMRQEYFSVEQRALELLGRTMWELRQADFSWILRKFSRMVLEKIRVYKGLVRAEKKQKLN